MAITVGSVTLDVVPDLTKFNAQMREAGRKVSTSVLVDADTTVARAAIRDVAKSVTSRVAVDVDTGEAKARIADLQSQIRSKTLALNVDTAEARARISDLKAQIAAVKATINVDEDDAAAKAKLKELRAELNKLQVKVGADTTPGRAQIDALKAEVARQKATINVNADTGAAEAKIAALGSSADSAGDSAARAGGGMSGLVAAALALAPALVPIGAAALAAAGGLATLGAAGVGAAGILAVAFSGVSSAVKLLGQEQQQSAAAGIAAANSAGAHAAAVANAQRQIQSAAMSLADAQRAAAATEISDQQRVASAQQGVADARRQAMDTQLRDSRAVESAEYSLAQAEMQERDAVKSLSDARESATRQLESYANRAADAQLSERQAVLDLQTAQANNLKTQASATATAQQRAQAELDLEKAQRRLIEAQQAATESAQDNTKAQQAGVNGAPQVVAAQQKVIDSQHAQKTATQNLADAQRKAAEDQAKSQESIAKAQQSLADAERTASADRVKSQESITRAQMQVAAAAEQLAQAQKASAGTTNAALAATQAKIAELDPVTRGFAQYLLSAWKPIWQDVQGVVAKGLLPGVQAGLESIRPIMPTLIGLIGDFARVMGDLAAQAGRALATPFWQDFARFAQGQMASGIKALAEIIGNLARGLAGLWQGFAPVNDIVINGLVTLSQRFADFGASAGSNSGFGKFIQYIKDSLPLVGQLFGDLFRALSHIAEALAPIGPPLIALLDQLLQALNRIPVQVLTDVALGIMAIVAAQKAWAGVQSIASLAGSIGELGPAGLAIAAIAGAVLLVYTNSKTFRDFVHDEVIPTLKQWGDWIMSNVVPALMGIWDWIVNKLVPVLAGIFMAAWNGIKDAVGIVSDAINNNRGELKQLWDVISAVVSWIVQNLLPLLGPILRGAFDLLGIAIGGIINAVGAVMDYWNRMWQLGKDIGAWFSGPFVGFFVGIWDGLKRGWADLVSAIGIEWVRLGDLVKAPINFVIGTVIDGFIGGVDNVFDFLKLGWHIPKLPLLADGGYTGPGDKWQPAGVVHAGEIVWSQSDIAAHGGVGAVESMRTARLPGYAEGGLVGDLAGLITNPGGALGDFFKSFGDGGNSGPFWDMVWQIPFQAVGAAAGAIGNAIKDAVTKLFWNPDPGAVNPLTKIDPAQMQGLAAVIGGPGGLAGASGAGGLIGGLLGVNLGGGTERWRGVVTQVVTMLGLPMAAINGILSLIQSESGGNPNAINLWDSNARAGHPSQGLMQTIPSTFYAYAGPFAGLGITNPLANVYAGTNYALQNYGVGMLEAGGRHSGGRYIGYRYGTDYVPSDQFAFLHRGEAVVPADKNAQGAPYRGPGYGGHLINIERVESTVDLELVARQMEYRQRAGAFS